MGIEDAIQPAWTIPHEQRDPEPETPEPLLAPEPTEQEKEEDACEGH